MKFAERYHLFEWLINWLLVIGPLLLVSYGLTVPGNWIEVVLGSVFLLPISLGALIFYGWLYRQTRRLAGYQWGILVVYGLSLLGSGALLITVYLA